MHGNALSTIPSVPPKERDNDIQDSASSMGYGASAHKAASPGMQEIAVYIDPDIEDSESDFSITRISTGWHIDP